MAWRWSLKKARKQRWQRSELSCFKNRGQGRIVSPVTRRRKPLSSFIFPRISLRLLQDTHVHHSASSSIKRTTYDYHRYPTSQQIFRPGKRSWKGWRMLIDTLTKLKEEKIKEADVTRHSSGSGQATTQLQSPKPLSPACTHTQVFQKMHRKLGGEEISPSRNFIVVPCRHGKWEIEFARFLWNTDPSLCTLLLHSFLVSHAR